MSELSDLEEYFSELAATPRFTQRAVNIPGDFRTSWRLAVLSLVLARGRASQLSLDHLHVLWWAIRTSSTRDLLMRWLQGEKAPDEIIVRFDPSLTVTVDLALGQKLMERTSSGLIKLTPSGHSLAAQVHGDPEILVTEKAFLEALPRKMTQRQISDLLEWK